MFNNLFEDKPLYLAAKGIRSVGTQKTEKEFLLTCEHVLTLHITGNTQWKFICSPAQLTELCLGWLCGEGYIRAAEDVETLEITADGMTAEARIRLLGKRPLEAFSAVCDIDESRCARAADLLMNGDNTHRKTRGTHQCIFMSADGQVVSCEDIGRTNAMDKTVGSMLMHRLSPGEGLLFFSGRVTAEIVKKAVRVGCPALVTKAAVTAQAVEAARRYRLQLAFFADGKSYFLPQ